MTWRSAGSSKVEATTSALTEGGGDDLGLDAALHVGDFFRTLVDQEDDLVHLGVILGDGVGDGLEQHRLTGFRLGDDQAALALADGGEHVHDAAGGILLETMAEEVELLRREEGSEEVERDAVADELRRAAVDVLDLHQREILVAFARRTDFTGDGVAVLQGVLLDLLLGDVDVVRGIQIVVVRGAEEAVAVGHDLQNARSLHGTFEFDALGLGLLLALLAFLLLLAGLVLLALLRFLLLLGIILAELVEETVDELFAVHFGGLGSRGLGGGFFDLHRFGRLLHAGALGLRGLLFGLFRSLFHRGFGGRLLSLVFGRSFRRFLGGSGFRLAAAGGFLRRLFRRFSVGRFRLLVLLGGSFLRILGRSLLLGGGVLLGLVFFLLGGTARLAGLLLLGGLDRFEARLFVQDGETQFVQGHLLRILDLHLLSQGSELFLAHRVQFQ